MANKATRISEAMKKAVAEGRKRKSYHSFGDEKGLTATVSAYGSLLQFTRHFPGKRTGFCVDAPGVASPGSPKLRLSLLLKCSASTADPFTIGPKLKSLLSDSSVAEVINHRWPTFRRKLDDGDVTLQYVAFDGTLYQIFELKGRLQEDLPFEMFTPNLRIQNLDHVPRTNKFNEAEVHDENVYTFNVRENCIIREHENGAEKVILYIQILDREMSLEFARTLKTHRHNSRAYSQQASGRGASDFDCSIKRKSTFTEEKNPWRKPGMQTIVLAYRLEHVSKEVTAVTPKTSWSNIVTTKCQLLIWRPTHSLVEDQTINFFLERNLEYILSVCSIPVRNETDDEDAPIALTCGDVSGHRIVTAASL